MRRPIYNFNNRRERDRVSIDNVIGAARAATTCRVGCHCAIDTAKTLRKYINTTWRAVRVRHAPANVTAAKYLVLKNI